MSAVQALQLPWTIRPHLLDNAQTNMNHSVKHTCVPLDSKPVCPNSLSPNAATVPSSMRAKLCSAPQATCNRQDSKFQHACCEGLLRFKVAMC